MKSIREAHAEVKAFLPIGYYVIIEHSYREYSTHGEVERWQCQVYTEDINPLELVFITGSSESIENMIEKAKNEYAIYQPDVDAKIARLEEQISKLRGRP